MQSVNICRARRFGLISLALVYPVLTGCGGGGGARPASVPPPITPPGLPGLDEGAAAELIREIDGEGTAWIALIEADDGRFSLTGRDTETNDLLAKLPEPARESSTTIPTRYSRYAYFEAILSTGIDPGRYLLWGRLAEDLSPETLDYTMQGIWTCTGCRNDGRFIQHEASGRISLTPGSSEGVFTFGGAGFAMRADLSLDKSGLLQEAGPASVSFNSLPQAVDRTRIRGGVFGPRGEEAGVLFGINAETRTFSGVALGVIQD